MKYTVAAVVGGCIVLLFVSVLEYLQKEYKTSDYQAWNLVRSQSIETDHGALLFKRYTNQDGGDLVFYIAGSGGSGDVSFQVESEGGMLLAEVDGSVFRIPNRSAQWVFGDGFRLEIETGVDPSNVQDQVEHLVKYMESGSDGQSKIIDKPHY